MGKMCASSKDQMTAEETAEVLADELPPITQFRDETVVVKYGGAAMEQDNLKANVMKDVAALSAAGARPVLVHGGGPEISRWLGKIGIEREFVGGKRVTSDDAMEVVEMVLAGKINKELVSLACASGAPAIGISGRDLRLLEARREETGTLGRVGEVQSVDASVIDELLNNEYVPIIATVAEDQDGSGALNVNADSAAGDIASSLGAEKLILMTDVPGILKDKDDATSLIQEATLSEMEQMQESGLIEGGMIPKVECATQAVGAGVSMAHIVDGRKPHALLLATLLEQRNVGTSIMDDTSNET